MTDLSLKMSELSLKATAKNKKIHHITNIRYQYAKTWDKRNTHVEFELANINSSSG